MNPYRKNKIYQVTIHGHIPIDMPQYKTMFYCFEKESEEHTHIGIELLEPMSKLKLIDFIHEYNQIEKNKIRVDAHKNWGTVWGYHYGFGDKPACEPAPVWLDKSEEDVNTMVNNRRMHKPLHTCSAVYEKTRTLLSKRPIECLAQGLVHLKGYSSFCRDHKLALEHLETDEDDIPEPPKKRHLWYYGPSNTGKSTMASSHGPSFVIPRNNDWVLYKGQKFLILEEFKGRAPWTIDLLQELCDCRGYTANTKGGSKALPRDAVVCITARHPPHLTFPDVHPEDLKGVLNRFNVIHLTHVYK